MKIIREGKLPEERVLTGACSNCHCHVEVKAGECTPDPDPREAGQLYVKCPTKGCGRCIWPK